MKRMGAIAGVALLLINAPAQAWPAEEPPATPGELSCDRTHYANIPATTPTPSDRFAFKADGRIVIDRRTGLEWMRCSRGQTWTMPEVDGQPYCGGEALLYQSWGDALESALVFNLMNAFPSSGSDYGTGWRLPNKNELESIVERSCFDPAINAALFPNTPSTYFWTSSPYARNPSEVWVVNSVDGEAITLDKSPSSGGRRVRLVRDSTPD